MLTLIALILASTSPIPHPTELPTWGNLIPWVVGFFGMMVSGMLYFVIGRQAKQLDELKLIVDQKLEKLANAVYLSHRARLVQMATDPQYHPTLKEQCETMVREIDDATAKR